MPNRTALYHLVITQAPEAHYARFLEVPLCVGIGADASAAREDLEAMIEPYLDQLVEQGGEVPRAIAPRHKWPLTWTLDLSDIAVGPSGPALAESLMTAGSGMLTANGQLALVDG